MASAARLGAPGGADLSSEAAVKDANASSSQAPRGTSDGPAGGGTGITTAAPSSSAAAAAGTTAAQQHPNLIGVIVGKMAKIQREGRGRRYRGLQAKLSEAIDAMNEFMGEEWPPEQEEEIAPPDWMDGGEKGHSLGNVNTTISVGGAAAEQNGSASQKTRGSDAKKRGCYTGLDRGRSSCR